ncbi:MAG: tripartite tricarboxylate transporter substrate binding protein [Rhodospirillaceae bacterium]
MHPLGRLAALCAALVLSFGVNAADDYPTKPIRLIAPSSPGSGVDIVARFLGQKLSDNMKQQVVVDNRAGAGANLGAEIAAHAPKDGYTLFVGTPAHTINPALYSRLNYDILKDFAPITQLTTGQYVLVVHPAVAAKNVSELSAMARAKPGKLNYASAGNGNATHLAGELYKSIAKIDIVHVPYKGTGPALTDLIGGQVQFMFPNLTAAMPQMKSGKLRALAVTGVQRSPSVPDIPTMQEAGVPGYSVTSWYALLAPAGVRADILKRLHTETVKAMSAPDMKDRLAGEGAEPTTGTPGQLTAFLKDEIAKWGKVIKAAGIKAE